MVVRVRCVGEAAPTRGVPPPVPPRKIRRDTSIAVECCEREPSARHGSQLTDELRMVKLAVVDEYVGVGVGGDEKGALADAGADQRPGFALAVPEADAAVAQVVW
jgi:hypothetical protein